MSAGIIGKWFKKAGDKISPGDSIAEIETDKASIAFEAQDEFYIAKIIASTGVEVAVGKPIMITVEEVSSIAAFADYKVTEGSAPIASILNPPGDNSSLPPVATATPAAVSTVIIAPPKVATSVVTSPVSVPAPAKVISNAVPQKSQASSSSIPLQPTFITSPLAAKLNQDRAGYIARYGRTGHVVLKK
jgi:pyruvate dehydrogenase E2 component (dihydrolipoamide acetyltransferase)